MKGRPDGQKEIRFDEAIEFGPVIRRNTGTGVGLTSLIRIAYLPESIKNWLRIRRETVRHRNISGWLRFVIAVPTIVILATAQTSTPAALNVDFLPVNTNDASPRNTGDLITVEYRVQGDAARAELLAGGWPIMECTKISDPSVSWGERPAATDAGAVVKFAFLVPDEAQAGSYDCVAHFTNASGAMITLPTVTFHVGFRDSGLRRPQLIFLRSVSIRQYQIFGYFPVDGSYGTTAVYTITPQGSTASYDQTNGLIPASFGFDYFLEWRVPAALQEGMRGTLIWLQNGTYYASSSSVVLPVALSLELANGDK